MAANGFTIRIRNGIGWFTPAYKGQPQWVLCNMPDYYCTQFRAYE